MRVLALAAVLLAFPAAALAQDGSGGDGIDVIDVSGPLDASALSFMAGSIEAAARDGQQLAVLQINAPAVLDSPGLEQLQDLVASGSQPLPVAIWIGPAPAAAFGGAAALTQIVDHAAIAPGAVIGRFEPVVLGEGDARSDEVISADESGLELQPTLRQYLQDLNGRVFQTVDGPVTVTTITEFGDGVTLKEVTFHKPGLADRFFRLAVDPEAAFFFLLAGLAVVTFEFFALGPGVAAAMGAISLLPAGWALVNLPTRWWALLLVFVGWALLTSAFQRGGLVGRSLSGAILSQVGGMTLIAGAGQLDASWWLILPTVLAVLFFFLVAMPTVQRARLSTDTIGRQSLIGRPGFALVDFDPDGLVDVGGARWRATAHREAGLDKGAAVVVTGVDGLYLEVEPVSDDREK